MKIIDCHTHLNAYGAMEGLTLPERIDRLGEQLDKWRLSHAVVLSSYVVNEVRPSTEEILRHLEGNERFSVVEGVGVTAKETPDWDGIEARLKAKRTRGIKIYPGYDHAFPTDPKFRPAVELCGRYKVPLMVHSGDTYAPKAKLKYAHPLVVDELCVDFPDVNFVICHCGNPWFRDTAAILYKNDNAYADISGLVLEEFTVPVEAHMRQELEDLLLYTGDPERILFGTDWPLVRMGPYLRFVENLELPSEQREMLLAGNASRLFGIPVGPVPKRAPKSQPAKAKKAAARTSAVLRPKPKR